MKIKENDSKKVKRKFEPFAFTVEVQSEEELIELYHRFTPTPGQLLKLYNNGVPPLWKFNSSNCTDVRDFIISKVGYYDIEI